MGNVLKVSSTVQSKDTSKDSMASGYFHSDSGPQISGSPKEDNKCNKVTESSCEKIKSEGEGQSEGDDNPDDYSFKHLFQTVTESDDSTFLASPLLTALKEKLKIEKGSHSSGEDSGADDMRSVIFIPNEKIEVQGLLKFVASANPEPISMGTDTASAEKQKVKSAKTVSSTEITTQSPGKQKVESTETIKFKYSVVTITSYIGKVSAEMDKAPEPEDSVDIQILAMRELQKVQTEDVTDQEDSNRN